MLENYQNTIYKRGIYIMSGASSVVEFLCNTQMIIEGVLYLQKKG